MNIKEPQGEIELLLFGCQQNNQNLEVLYELYADAKNERVTDGIMVVGIDTESQFRYARDFDNSL